MISKKKCDSTNKIQSMNSLKQKSSDNILSNEGIESESGQKIYKSGIEKKLKCERKIQFNL